MQQINYSMSGIAVTMIMVLVMRQYVACCWKGASEAESALDNAGKACMACTWAQSNHHHDHCHTLHLMLVGLTAT